MELENDTGYFSYSPENGNGRFLRSKSGSILKRLDFTQGAFLESSLLSVMDHPNIIKHTRVVRIRDEYYLEFKFISETLQSLLSSGIHFDRKKVAFQIACGLAYLHKNRILHLDLKPYNILIDRVWAGTSLLEIPKIIDFDISEVIPVVCVEKITETYRPPENLEERAPYTASSDVWSLGMIFYYIFTGVCPVPKLTYARSLYPVWGLNVDGKKVINQKARMNTLNRLKDEKLISLVDSMLDPDFSKRPSIQAVLESEFFRGFSAPKINFILDPENSPKPGTGPEIRKIISKFYTENQIKYPVVVKKLAINLFERVMALDEEKDETNIISTLQACSTVSALFFYCDVKLTREAISIWRKLDYKLYYPSIFYGNFSSSNINETK